MDTDRPSTINYAEQYHIHRIIWSTRSNISLSSLSNSQNHGTSDRNDSSQSAWLFDSRNLNLPLMATNTASNAVQARSDHRLPRLFHNVLNLLRRECTANQSGTAKTRSVQYSLSGSQWSLPLDARNLGWQPALHLLKKTPESPKTDQSEEIEDSPKRKPRRFFCKKCKQWVAFVSDAIQVDDIPTLTLQINPHGFVHEVITVKYVVHCLIAGPPVPADSWFPGYEWRFLICQQCQAHLGWSYHAPNETTMSFAGLRRATILEE